ncbi:flagellar biosynthetic protein FliO [Ramlibacter sp. WS9]|uniref:flagellar biosynthetic protein FliO n=1 Tax=Ramlibacter sp. WS9 TaxID=1882741 RepID=UPI001144EAB6|nr:flagellar biosynthetic protein FliO [Ramlibacter sp. WS9]ROZ63200.1 hypothetical protein EEB15_30120 [Ramlibacter sp. WS9]
MLSKHLRISLAALTVWVGSAPDVGAQIAPPASSASAASPFSQIPLRRDSAADGSAAASAGWAVLFVAVVAGVGLLLIRRKAGAGVPGGWLRPASGKQLPKALGRVPLTPQASLHVVEWQGEELLLGCTAQSVTVVARRPCDDVKVEP